MGRGRRKKELTEGLDTYKELYIGKIYGKLTIINIVAKRNKQDRRLIYATCKCECGNIKDIRLTNILRGTEVSCGCYNIQLQQNLHKHGSTHKLTKHPLYPVWKSMHSRCYNPNNDHYRYYGNRGIYICDEWRRKHRSRKDGNPEFIAFYTWAINSGYKPGLTIDRIDNNGPYAPWNCRWISNFDQAHNRSTCHYAIIDGNRIPLSVLLREYNLPSYYINNKVRELNWSYNAAIYSVIHHGLNLICTSDGYVDDNGFVRLIPSTLDGGRGYV